MTIPRLCHKSRLHVAGTYLLAEVRKPKTLL